MPKTRKSSSIGWSQDLTNQRIAQASITNSHIEFRTRSHVIIVNLRPPPSNIASRPPPKLNKYPTVVNSDPPTFPKIYPTSSSPPSTIYQDLGPNPGIKSPHPDASSNNAILTPCVSVSPTTTIWFWKEKLVCIYQSILVCVLLHPSWCGVKYMCVVWGKDGIKMCIYVWDVCDSQLDQVKDNRENKSEVGIRLSGLDCYKHQL